MPALNELPAVLVVDASVGVKWVVDEIGSEIAAGLIAGRRLLVPDLGILSMTACILPWPCRRIAGWSRRTVDLPMLFVPSHRLPAC